MNSSLCSLAGARLSRRSLLTRLVVLSVAWAIAAPALADRELHVVGLYEGIGGGTDAKITVDRPGQSVTLFLSAYDMVNWQIHVVDGTTLERVLLQGYHPQSAVGVPAGVPVSRNSYEEGTGYVLVGYSLDSSRFLRSIPTINSLTGQEIASFHGGYQPPAEPILINAVQDDPRLSASNPKPVPLDQLPDVHYQIATYQEGSGGVVLHDYTLAGPGGGTKIIPDGVRVSPDGAKRFYYGGDDGLTEVDSTNGATRHIPLPEDVQREGWQMGTAFDTLRARGLVVTLAGEGFVYAYSPASSQWTTAFSMRNRDFDCLEYHAASDTLWGVTLSHLDSTESKLVGLKAADGSLVREIPLPPLPFSVEFGDHRAEIVSAGEYLVLLLQPASPFYSGYQSIPESRIYLIDPRTGEMWLTYRSTTPPNQPPEIQIISPAQNQAVTAGSTLRIAASAHDTGGNIASVEFLVDDVSIGLGTFGGGSDYRIDWTVPASGEHRITAKAKDNLGATAVSQAVVVRVNVAPIVRLVQPEDGSTLPSGVPIDLKATASDSDGSVAAVHFLVDRLPIGQGRRVDGADDYLFAWTPTRPGDHTIQARATDSLGAVVFSDIATIHVTAPAGSLKIVTPPDGSSFVQFSRVGLVALASGIPDLTSIEFFVDGESIGRGRRIGGMSAFLSWVARGVGDHAITARATLRSGDTITSPAIKVIVTSEGGIARRLLPAQYRPGRTLRAGILIIPGRGAGIYTVTETPPAGWIVSAISDGGTFDGATGKITFGPIAADRVALLTYSLTPPPGTKGAKAFSGTLDVDGAVTSISGQQTINGPKARLEFAGR